MKDIKDTIEGIANAFDEFKHNNEARLNDIEKRAGRLPYSHTDVSGYDAKDVVELREILEGKSMNSLTGADGGFVVPM